MTVCTDSNIEIRIRTALELCDLGAELVEQRLRRENPTANEAEIRKRVADWYSSRPGAEDGDAFGIRGQWPR